MIVTLENSPHFVTPPEVSPQNDIWGMSAENSTLKMCHYPGLVSEAIGGVAKSYLFSQTNVIVSFTNEDHSFN